MPPCRFVPDIRALNASSLLPSGAETGALVLGLLLYVLLRHPGRPSHLAAASFVYAGGVALAIAVLVALPAGALMSPSSRPVFTRPVEVEVIGHPGWWEARYRGPGPSYLVIGATELRLPVGRDIAVALKSFGGTHAFRVPELADEIAIAPGAEQRVTLHAQAPGRMRNLDGQMVLDVVAQPPEEYEQWLEAQRAPAFEPSSGEALRGRNLFMSADCGLCHTVRGTSARGKGGPDLTHLGSRRRIAGGMLENTPESLEAWVVHAQALKPGSRMPDTTEFTGAELRDLVAYLQALD